MDSYQNSVDEENPRIARNACEYWISSAPIIGITPLSFNKVTSWGVKILESRDNARVKAFIGVAPSNIDQNEDDNSEKCGWYFYCYCSALWSGPPYNYEWKKAGKYVHTGNSVGVVMDTAKGDHSFVLNGVNLGVIYI